VGTSDVGSEVELILARASIFTPVWAMALNICNPPPLSPPALLKNNRTHQEKGGKTVEF